MVKRDTLSKNEIWSLLVLTLTFLSNQILGSHRLDLLKFILPVLVIGFIYCTYLSIKDFATTKKAVFSLPMLWILGMNILLYIYGAIWNVNPEVYARSYQFLNLAHLLICVVILFHIQDKLTKILPYVAALSIILESIFVVIYNFSDIIMNFTGGDEYGDYTRIGTTPCAGVIETCITMCICMIPLIHLLIVKKKGWCLIPIGFGLVTIAASMQKTAFIILAMTVLVIVLGISDDKKVRWRNFAIVAGVCVLGLIISYIVPFLRVNIYDRFADLFYTLVNLDISNAHSSSGKRLRYVVLCLKHTWDKPFLGHGLYTFGHQVYGFDRTETVYPDTHNNIMEMLYSCGLLGLTVYYWFPVKQFIDTIRMKHSEIKLVVVSMILSMLLYDFVNITFYRNIIGYLVFVIVYMLIKNEKADSN